MDPRAPGSQWPEELQYRRQDFGSAVRLSLIGELDLASVPGLQAQLAAAADSGNNLILDLSGLRYIDSSGVKAFLDAHRNFSRTKRRIVLAAPSPMTRRILTVLSIGDVIPMFETVDAALEYLKA